MRGSSWWFLMASNQNSGIWVLFSAEFNGIVQIPDFRQAHHYKTTIFGFWEILYKYILYLAFLGKLLSIFAQITLAASPTATGWGWIFPESNFLYSGDPIRFNQFNYISRLAKPSFVLLIFWKCTTESRELGLKNILRRYHQKCTNRGGYLLPSLQWCSNE